MNWLLQADGTLEQPLAGDDELDHYTTELKLAVEEAMARLRKLNSDVRAHLRVFKERQAKAEVITHKARQRLSELQSRLHALVQPYSGDSQARIHDVAAKCTSTFNRLHDDCINYLNDLATKPPHNPCVGWLVGWMDGWLVGDYVGGG